ncbi:MAG: hypothetical protein ACFB12_09695 [Leptolyngbyaceae cyanobacterium]
MYESSVRPKSWETVARASLLANAEPSSLGRDRDVRNYLVESEEIEPNQLGSRGLMR